MLLSWQETSSHSLFNFFCCLSCTYPKLAVQSIISIYLSISRCYLIYISFFLVSISVQFSSICWSCSTWVLAALCSSWLVLYLLQSFKVFLLLFFWFCVQCFVSRHGHGHVLLVCLFGLYTYSYWRGCHRRFCCCCCCRRHYPGPIDRPSRLYIPIAISFTLPKLLPGLLLRDFSY